MELGSQAINLLLIGSTDETLPQLGIETLVDFAYVDGCHGYPFPALDWHYIDGRLRVGGIIGMDNAELRPSASIASS